MNSYRVEAFKHQRVTKKSKDARLDVKITKLQIKLVKTMSLKKYSLFAAMFGLLLGCATPDPSMISPGVYMVSRTSAAGSVFVNMAQLKADTIDAANRFAESKGKVAVAVSMRDERPIPGFPLVEYQFRLAEPGSISDATVTLKKDADITIQRDEKITIKPDQISPKESPKDLYAELLKLEDLRKRGILNDDEFQEQKKKLLANR